MINKIKLLAIGGVAVHVPTQEECYALRKIYEAGGWKWANDKLPTEWDCWDIDGAQTCMDMGRSAFCYFGFDKPGVIEQGSMEEYGEIGTYIITFGEFLEIQKISPEEVPKLLAS